MRSLLAGTAILFLFCQPLHAYVLEGPSWTRDRTVAIQLSLGGETTLRDGSSSFDEVAAAACNVWNPYLAHLQLAPHLGSPVTPAADDDENSIYFSNTVFGDTFGSGTLAVTSYNYRGTVMEEADTTVNTAYTWDSYRGPLLPGVEDLRRVLIHELGHALGLDHPDDKGQNVVAIMNSHVSDIDTVQPDDIAGVQSLYNSGPAYQSSVDAPVLRNISTRGLVGTGDSVLIGGFIVQGSGSETDAVIVRAIGFSLSADGIAGPLSDPLLTIYDSNHNQVAQSDDWFTDSDASTIASFHLDPENSREPAIYVTLAPGEYTAVMQSFSDAQQPPETGVGLVEIYDLQTSGGARCGNISTRGQVLAGDNVLIGGLIVGGNDPKEVVVRAIGPSLGSDVANPLSDPTLAVYDSNGTLLQANNDWGQGQDANAISAAGFAPQNPKESALLQTLNPGNYTAIVSGVNGATGIGLVEVYDLSASP